MRNLLLLGYAAAAGMLAGLWLAFGWQWGAICIVVAVLIHIACNLLQAVCSGRGWG